MPATDSNGSCFLLKITQFAHKMNYFILLLELTQFAGHLGLIFAGPSC